MIISPGFRGEQNPAYGEQDTKQAANGLFCVYCDAVKRSEILFGIARIPLDALAAFAALLLAYRLREANIDLLPRLQLLSQPSTLPPLDYYFYHFVLPAVIAYVTVAAVLRMYSLRTTLGPWNELWRTIMASVLWITLIMAWFFMVQRQLFFSRVLLIQSTVFLTFFALVGRTAMILFQRKLLKLGIGVRTVVSCGSHGLPESVSKDLTHDVRYRFLKHAETFQGITTIHEITPIDLVLHTDTNPSSAKTAELIDYCRSHQIGYAYVPPVFADVPHQLSIGVIGLVPVLKFEPTPLDGWGRVLKRIIDFLLGFILFVILSPLFVIIAILILLTSGWPIFYISRRVGQYGKSSIPLLKFRSMCRNADEKKHVLQEMSHRSDGPLFKVKNDPRVTPIGRFLRRYSIDELPQLCNVIVGQLSLVGPRPHLPSEVDKYALHHRRVFTVRPGITGLAQISGRSDLPFEEEVKLDMRYIEDWSLLLDIWILWRTIFVVLFGRGE